MGGGGAGPTAGALYALGSALVWTLISLLVRALAPYLSTISINVVRSTAGGIVLATVVAAGGGAGALRGVSGGAYAYLAVSTVLSSTSPLFALPIGVLAFGEKGTWRAAAGAALCVVGIGLLTA